MFKSLKLFLSSHKKLSATGGIFILFWILTFPAFKALLQSGMITGHDIEGHLVRLMEFTQALNDGHFPVRWSKRLDFGLGYPFFLFDYPLIYHLGDLIHRLGWSFVDSIKIILLLSFPLSGFFTYLWLRSYFGVVGALTGGLFYTIFPYHFVNVYVRGAVAEAVAMTFVPLVFYLIDRVFKKPTLLTSAFLALGIAVVTLSHNITIMVFSAIWVIYALVKYLYEKNRFRRASLAMFFVGAAWAGALTAFFIIPAFAYKGHTNLDELSRRYYVKNFPSFKSLLYSPWGYGGSKVGVERGEMSFQVGIPHQLVVLGALAVLVWEFKRRQNIVYKLSLFSLGLFFGSGFLMLGASRPLWDAFIPLQYLEFPWRLLGVAALGAAFLTGYLLFSLQKFGKTAVFLAVVLLISGVFFFNRNHWRANEYYTWVDYWVSSGGYFGTTTAAEEHIPKWHDDGTQQLPYFQSHVVEGKAKVEDLLWRTNLHRFRIKVEEPSLVVDRTDYFPGWTVFRSGKKVENVSPYTPGVRGHIGFRLDPGEYLVEVRLLETALEKLADGVSAAALLALFIVVGKGLLSRRVKDGKSLSAA